MSATAFAAFVEKVQNDPGLARAVDEAIGDRRGAAVAAAVAGEARARGYDVADDEVLAMARGAAEPGSDGPLADDDLDAVAGGNVGQFFKDVGKWIHDRMVEPNF